MAPTVAILGCGYVGLALGRQLADTHEVVGVRRSDEGLEAIRGAGFEAVRADLTDDESLRALPDAHVVVYAASTGRNASPRAIYNTALEAVIEEYASRDSPPDRLIYTGSTGVYGDHDGAWVDEETPIYPDTDRQRVLLEAERLTLEAAPGHGIDGTVVRFGGLYGPDRYRLERYLDGPVTEGWLNLVHREDAAGAVRYAIQQDVWRNERLLAVDTEPLEKWAFADWLADECDVPPPPKQTIDERLADPALSASAAHRIQANKRCSSRKLQESGYDLAFPTAREGYRPAIESYLAE